MTKKTKDLSITERLKTKITDYPDYRIDPKEIIKHPITKIAIGTLIVYGVLISSTYFINGYADFVKATKNLKSARNR
ncbi:MAG: hypothetical protein AB8F74_04160 [Saprospiraceae bacterium]